MDIPTQADTTSTVLQGTAQCGSDNEDVDANPVAEFSSLVVKLQCNIVPVGEEEEGDLLCGKFGGKSHRFHRNCHIDQKCHSFIKVRDDEITMNMVEELRQMSELRKFHRQEADTRSDGFAHLYGWFWTQDRHILVFDSLYEKLLPFLRTPECSKLKRRHLCIDLCNGLSFLHNSSPRLLHGAVVPENVFVSSEGRAKLTDLSRAWIHRGKWRRLYRKAKYPYTQLEELYLSPEMLKSKAVDEKHDVFSFAILMMQILTDSIPNPKYKVGTKEETIRREDDLNILYRKHREYCEIVRKCLQQKPKYRPSTCEVAKDLSNMEALNVPPTEEAHTDSPLVTPVDSLRDEPPQTEPQQQLLGVQPQQDFPPSLFVRAVPEKENYIEQTVKLKFSGKLARFVHSGFIPNIHYNKVDNSIYGSVHLICMNDEEDEPLSGSTGSYPSLSSPTYVFVKELNRDDLPSLFYKTYKFLSNPKHIHQNVCSLLGAVVDFNVVENTTVTRIFEEFTDLNLEEFLNQQPNSSFKSVIRWIFELFDALRYLHENGIVHRRLYGDAVRMSGVRGTLSEFQVKISFLMENDSALKPFYRSPEYYEHGTSARGPSDDIWMAACNVILMVTRRHPWQGIPPQEVEHLICSLYSDNTMFDRLVHMDILNSELHQYQKQALENLFQRIFLAKSTLRASANEIVRECFHFCSISPQSEPEPKLLLSRKSSDVTRFTSVREDTLICCTCWSEADNYNISLNRKLVAKMATTGVAVKVQVNYILYGAIHSKGGRTVGPAALFYSPVNFECGESVRLLIPTFGTKSSSESSSEPIATKSPIRTSRSFQERSGSISEKSWTRSYSTPESSRVPRHSSTSTSPTSSSSVVHGCEIKPFVGEYSVKDDLYIFRESPGVSFSSCDPSRMLVHVCSSIFLQPMCLCAGHKNASESCPVYLYEVRGYRPKDPLGELEGETGGQVCIVVFIKSPSWESILDQEFPPEDWSFTKEIIHTSVWTKIGVSIKSKSLNKSSYIWREDVDDINDSPSKLQQRVEKGEYPMRVTFDTMKGMYSSITVTIPGEEEESKVVMEITTATSTPKQQRNSVLSLDSLKEEEYSLDSTPSQHHLLKYVLEPLGVDRAKFCIHLGVSIEQVGTAQQMGHSEVAYLQVLKPWLHGKIRLVKPTWRSVVQALHETGQVRWSEKLEEMIKTRTLT